MLYTNRSAKQAAAHATLRLGSASLLIVFTLLALSAEASAQETADAGQPQQPQRDAGPPPMRYLPDEVRQRLNGARDPKERARISMEIAEERLTRAAQYAGEDHFEQATGEIGVYEAVVEDTVRTLSASNISGRANNKLRDIFKRVEITLRSHITRLESIRRLLPERHAVYLKDAIEFVRDHRDEALGAFYSDSVMREPRTPELTTPAGERATTNAAAQPDPDRKPDQRQQR